MFGPLVNNLSPMGRAGGVVAPPLDPTTISGLKLWYAPRKMPVVADGMVLTQLDDFSGNSFHATQATSTKRALYKTNIIAGYPAALFDGVDDTYLTGTLAAFQTFSLFVVAKSTTNVFPGSTSYFGGDSTLPTGTRMFQFRINVTGQFEVIGFNTSGTISDTRAVTPTNFNVLSAQRLAASVECFVNGSSDGATTGGTAKTAASEMAVGSRGGSDGFLTGYIAEVLMYAPAISQANHDAIVALLKNIYGL